MPKSSVGRPSKLAKSLAKHKTEAVVCAPDLPNLSYRLALPEEQSDDEPPPLVIASYETLSNKPSTRRNKKLIPQPTKSKTRAAAAEAAASPTESEAAAIAALAGTVTFPPPSESDQRQTQPQLQFMQTPQVLLHDGTAHISLSPPPQQQVQPAQQLQHRAGGARPVQVGDLALVVTVVTRHGGVTQGITGIL